MLTFWVPVSVSSDAGKEVTAAEVVGHVCRCLKVSTDVGPADHPIVQWALNRMEGVAPRGALQIYQTRSGRWDSYMLVACWSQRTTLDTSLPSQNSPFRPLLGEDNCKQLDDITPDMEGRDKQWRVNTFVVGKRKSARNHWMRSRNATATSRHGNNTIRVSSIQQAGLAPRYHS